MLAERWCGSAGVLSEGHMLSAHRQLQLDQWRVCGSTTTSGDLPEEVTHSSHLRGEGPI
jgi:hypothetical protein